MPVQASHAPFAAALLGAALAACAAPGVQICRVPTPRLPPPPARADPVPFRVAASFDPSDVLTVTLRSGTRVLPLGEPLLGAFEQAARDLSRSPPRSPEPPASAEGDATLSVGVSAFRPGIPVEIDVEATLRAPEGRVLAAVRATGRSPGGVPFSGVDCEGMVDACASAIGDAAARIRDALASAPAVAALRSRGIPPPGPASGPEPPAVDLRPRVEQFADLRWPAARDPVVASRVEALAARRSTSQTLAGVGVTSLLTAALAAIPRTECSFGVCSDHPVSHPEVAAAFGIASAALLAAAIAVWPGRDAWREVVDLWNRRHPDQPLEVAPAPPADPDGRAPMTVP
jgi:hypothetical protein